MFMTLTKTGLPLLYCFSILMAASALATGCSNAQEAIDYFDSSGTCKDYCSKKYDCKNASPSAEETKTCVTACRNSIEDNCGNEHQHAANDKIAECVDKACIEFTPCMVFDAAPTCFGFVSP